ncbi:MAG: dihydrofolate reductase [Acidobacteria bacterium]|nr:dihydrofolate reductase [Acidobacteriota bacterium]
MVASLDGFVAKHDSSTGWLEVSDTFDAGDSQSPEDIEAFLKTIDCYVMGSRTYETALDFEAKGFGWAYGATPVIVLTHRTLPNRRGTVEFFSGDLECLTSQLAARFGNIWVVGGASLSADFLRLGLAGEVRYSILPIALGSGISFFQGLDKDIALHLLEVKTYKTGMVTLRYQTRK